MKALQQFVEKFGTLLDFREVNPLVGGMGLGDIAGAEDDARQSRSGEEPGIGRVARWFEEAASRQGGDDGVERTVRG